MSTPTFNLSSEMRNLMVIFMSMLAGLFLFAGVSLAIGEAPEEKHAYYLYIGLVVLFLGFMGGLLIDKQIHRPGPSAALEDKFKSYRNRKIIRWALIETGVLVNILLYFLDRQSLLLMLAGLGLALMASLPPSREQFSREYQVE